MIGDISTFSAPSNGIAGGVYRLIFVQDNVGSRTLSGLNSVFKTNGTLTLSTSPDAIDIIDLICVDSNTYLICAK
jgi:hypothetical protein